VRLAVVHACALRPAAVLVSRGLGSAVKPGRYRGEADVGSADKTVTTRTETAPEVRTNATPMAAALRDGVLDRATHEDAVRVGAVLEGVETGTGPLGVADTGLGGLSEVDTRSEEHTSELQSREKLVCRLLLEKKQNKAK